MIRIHIFCEGQTEEAFVRDILYDHFYLRGIVVNPILLKTGRYGKGGVVSYEKIKRQIIRKCKEDKSSWITTMIDYYGLPKDFPGRGESRLPQDLHQKSDTLNAAFSKDIAQSNFIPNFLMHEFEALLYSNPDVFFDWFEPDATQQIIAERNQFTSPEHINDNPNTAPSKRIIRHCDKYDKIAHGTLLSIDIGLDRIRQECTLFDAWLTTLENLAT